MAHPVKNGVIVGERQEFSLGIFLVNGYGHLVCAEYTVIVLSPFDRSIDIVGFVKQIYGCDNACCTVSLYFICRHVAAVYGE